MLKPQISYPFLSSIFSAAKHSTKENKIYENKRPWGRFGSRSWKSEKEAADGERR
jgi:hypothetical protein